MQQREERPRIFVGSSAESLPFAYAVQENLERYAEVTVWDQGVFQPSRYVLEALAHSINAFDFAVFIFAPDDISIIRESEYQSVRDNVVFEIGLFIGALGRERTFLLAPKGISELRLPSDLLGLTFASFDSERRDGNKRAALGPACNQIAQLLKSGGMRVFVDGIRPAVPEEVHAPSADELDQQNPRAVDDKPLSGSSTKADKSAFFAKLREMLTGPVWDELLESDDLPVELVERLSGARLVNPASGSHQVVLPNRSSLLNDSRARIIIERALQKRVGKSVRVIFRTEKAEPPTVETFTRAWNTFVSSNAPAGSYQQLKDARVYLADDEVFHVVLGPRVSSSVESALKGSDFRTRAEEAVSDKLRWSVELRVLS